ncbi:MAG TPA: 2-oxoacid:acceptor oxidoreductase family protein, partial [Methylomirabilota bacterium]|nr:2-oxoacid:acceptor oxidoreductase family protein [Methylomirabilota bacterium]
MRFGKKAARPPAPKYPGIPAAVDGSTAVVFAETAAAEAAAACPITPAAAMSDGWAAAAAAGATNAEGRPLVFFQSESGHAAAAVAAGLAMTGLRAGAFAGGQGVAELHESLYAAVGKRLPWVLHVACRAMTKQALSIHAGHDDYHAVDDSGCFQLFAKNVQEVADLALIAHRIAELSLNPGICAQDGLLTSHTIESIRLPERELVREYLGDPADLIESPTPAQRLVFGERRRRIPELFDLDYPAALGIVQGRESYAQGVAAQRPFYFDHLAELADRAFEEYAALTGRRYARCAGYRLDDAEYVLVGQGSVVSDAEAVCDHLRATRKLRIGVLGVTTFRPFPADLLAAMLRGKRAAVVLERTDQPLAVDPPLLREIRAAVAKAVENWRARSATPPHPTLASCAPDDVPDFYSACFGLGGRDLQPGDLVAAVENMLERAPKRRQFYLGVDFLRPETRLPKLQIWQEQLLAGYPHLADLALAPAAGVHVAPDGALAVRLHSLGGWGAATLARTLALTAAEVFGLSVKAHPRYDAAPTGQPTAFSAVLAREPVRLNGEPRRVDVVLSPDPNSVRHSDPLAGLVDGGLLVIQGEGSGAESWRSVPPAVRRALKARRVRVFALDALRIAAEEVAEPELRRRVQGVAFLGAFFRLVPLGGAARPHDAALFRAIGARLATELGQAGEGVVEANLRVVRRGFAEVEELDPAAWDVEAAALGTVPARPALLDGTRARPGLGHPGRFWEQVGYLHATGCDPIADPFAAVAVLPAATSTLRDLTDVRLEVPEFVPARCTGCGQCWTHCPESAIPGLVTPIDQVLETALRAAAGTRPADRLRQLVRPLANESRRLLKERPFPSFAEVLAAAYPAVVAKLDYGTERRATLDAEFAAVHGLLTDFPLARTAPFFDGPESRTRGSGALLSVTVNPETCKGCGICVEVCRDGALRPVRQTEAIVEMLRRSWRLWQELPETDDRYVELASHEEAIGPLAALLLKKEHYLSMLGGDVACAGCGEKTVLHLVLSAVQAHVRPRVRAHVARLDELIRRLDEKARRILASDADLGQVTERAAGLVDIPLEDAKQAHVGRIAGILRDLRDLRWRYTEGPGGRGRAACGVANATGCSSAWASRFPLNPYPVPWVHHLVQDAPSLAVGVFEGQMRKMADGFRAIRRAELELADAYDPVTVEPELARLDWRGFTGEEGA